MRQVGVPELLNRHKKGSLREMAKLTGMSVNNIKALYDGRIKPTMQSLPALAEAYGIDPQVLALASYGLYYEDEESQRNPAGQREPAALVS
jgi:transcriptional regulator with XRE-family HTH domain